MIQVKTAKEIEQMRLACQISAEVLILAGRAVKPGVSTAYIDKVVYDYIVSQGAKPNFKGYGGFPGSACISVNDVVIHGIPSKSIVLKEGDIVSIDVGASINGFNGDNAATFPCGEIS
ncbi:MAG: M24 family metallopeptidase, partial [Oscillospiraceae bacterium]